MPGRSTSSTDAGSTDTPRAALGLRTALPFTVEAANTVYRLTNTPDTPAQLSDLIRSVEARITTHQQERQALVAQLQDIRRTSERLLVALVDRAEAPRGRGRPRKRIKREPVA